MGILPSVWGQVSLMDSTIGMTTLDIRYRGALPRGPMAERWGYLSTIGMEVGYKWKSNVFLTTGGSFVFSDAVNIEGILDPILTDGFLITDDGQLTDVRVLGEGLLIPLTAGYILPFGPKPNPNSGFFVSVGAQYFRYRFNIRPIFDEVAGLDGDYAKGYDNLIAGVGVNESIGYRYFGNRNGVNFTFGIEASQNVTRHRRSVLFAIGTPPEDLRTDLLFGFFAAWTFPLFQRAPNRVYYY